MTPIIHAFGIATKYIFINIKAFVLFMRSKSTLNLDSITKVVFTHNLGGGTESYIKLHFLDEQTLIVRLVSYRNDSFFSLETVNKKIICTQKVLFSLLEQKTFNEVIINSFVAYKNI